ncbi:MAG: hypothetical protein R3Y52_01255 [Psittacicella sp.]
MDTNLNSNQNLTQVSKNKSNNNKYKKEVVKRIANEIKDITLFEKALINIEPEILMEMMESLKKIYNKKSQEYLVELANKIDLANKTMSVPNQKINELIHQIKSN